MLTILHIIASLINAILKIVVFAFVRGASMIVTAALILAAAGAALYFGTIAVVGFFKKK